MASVTLSRPEAELFAARVLEWLCADAARLGAFMGATGAASADLRNVMRRPGFLLAVIDFLLADEGQLLACCEELGVPPERPAQARAALPGGAEPHWT